MTTPTKSVVILGAPGLASAELRSVLQRSEHKHQLTNKKDHLVILDGTLETQVCDLLGGAVKAAEILYTGEFEGVPQAIADSLGDNLTKVKLALSSFDLDDQSLKKIGNQVRNLSQAKINFRILKSPMTSSGLKSKYLETIIIKSDSLYHVARTYWVQDIDYWSWKDYQRPYADPHSGMLPPKIARIMLNLALPAYKSSHSPLIYDPMCGSGTIIMEAIDMNLNAIGSDISPNSAQEALINAQWLKTKMVKNGSVHTFQKDITQLKPTDLPSEVDAIVFEGYLGPPSLDGKNIKNIYKGFQKLYTGAIKRILPLVKTNHKIVMALPEIHYKDTVKTLDSLIDTCEKYGYTPKDRHSYGRPHAQIKRTIYTLVKN